MSVIVRLGIAAVCCAAMMSLEYSSCFAQGRAGFGSRGVAGATSGEDKDDRQTTKKRFDELLEDRNLDKFRGYASEAIGDGWKISGKYLHFDGSGGGDIITKETYGDFELQFDYKVAKGGNSGVMYRVSTGDKAPYFSGPEFQILDDANHKDGKNEATSAGAIYGLYAPGEAKSTRTTWNSVKIIVEDNKVVHYLNNKKIIEAEIGGSDWNKKVADSKFKDWEKFGKNSSGHIAFQDHGDEVWFRNIRIKKLDSDSAGGDIAHSALDDRGRGRTTTPNEALMNKKRGMMPSATGKISGAGGSIGDKDKDKDKNKGGK